MLHVLVNDMSVERRTTRVVFCWEFVGMMWKSIEIRVSTLKWAWRIVEDIDSLLVQSKDHKGRFGHTKSGKFDLQSNHGKILAI